MTGFERYLAVVKGGSPDFPPRIPILMQFAAERIGSNYGAFASDYRVLVEANTRCAAEFGIDQLSSISDPYRETQGFGAQIEYVRDGVPRCLRHPLVDSKDLSTLTRPNPLASERMLDRVNVIRSYASLQPKAHSFLGWVEGPAAEAADLRGVSEFLIDTMDDESFACELMDLCVEVAVEFAQAQVDAGADTIGIGDAIASQLSPDLYERLVQPREKRLVAAIKQMGAHVRLHICGNTTHLLSGISDLGIDILDVDHMVDLAAARRAVGAKTALAGNLDPVAVIQQGTPASIRAALRRAHETAGAPYMVNAGCEIPPGTPPANLMALCEPL